MFFLRVLQVAAMVTTVLAYGGPRDRNAQCSSVSSEISRCYAESEATSYCSSFLSIGTKTVTARTTRSRPSTTQGAIIVTSTITPKTTITQTVTSTSAPQIVVTSTTITSISTSTFSATSTLTSSSLISRTTTITSLSSSTSTTSETSFTTSVSTSTSTTSVLNPQFSCFTSFPPAKRDAAKRDERRAAQTGLPQDWWRHPCDAAHRQQISSACSCLSIPSKTTTVACTSTGIAPAPGPPGRTVTSTVTASPTTIVTTTTTFATLPVVTSTVTRTATQSTSTTVTVTISTSSISTTTFTSVVTSATLVTSTVQVPSTTTTTTTTTSTSTVGTGLTFQITTPNSGSPLFAAAAVSESPYNFFYFRSQGSGATTFQLDENCQLLETFAGVYAQQKPSSPNPGLVYSGSGVPVTCKIDVATDMIICTNPQGGSQTFSCDTTFGANNYNLWWLGLDQSPGSRCQAVDTFAKFSL